ncbi:hypothetical protein D3C76_783770 [compost metagenome]
MSDQLELRRRHRWRLGLGVEVQIDFFDGVGVGHLLSGGAVNDALLSRQQCWRNFPATPGRLQQQLTHLRRRVEQRGPAVENTVTAGGVAFVGRQRRIGGEQVDRCRGNLQTFSGNLQQGSFDAGAQFDLTGVDGDAFRADADPGIEIGIGAQAAGQIRCQHHRAKRINFGVRPGTPRRRHQGKRHQQDPPTQESAATVIDLFNHHHIALPFCLATRLIASIIRRCVPQRHRLPAMYSRMVCSSGCGLLSSNDCARINMPAMQ